MTAAKLKVSLTLSADVVALVDRDALRRKNTRSGIIEQWLRRAANVAVESELVEATAAYYTSLGREEAAEDEAIARASSKASRRVSYDDPSPRRRKRAPK